MMEIEAKLEKRIAELETQLEQSKEEYAELKATEERTIDKCLKLKDKLESEERRWRERWWKVELDRRKLEIDLNVSANKSNESEAEVERLKSLLDEKESTIRGLIAKEKAGKEEGKTRMGKACKRIKDLVCEKMALKAEHDRKISELVSRVEEVEREIEAEDGEANRGFMEKMEWMEMERVDLNDKTWDQIEKEIMGSGFVNQVEVVGSSVEKEIGTEKCKPKWESGSGMLNALSADDELCMRSVCALYRKHKSLGSWKNGSALSSTAFKPIHEKVGMALGELLTNGDPQGRVQTSLAKFKRANPLDLEDCRLIARYHHMELFEIYKNNLDPLFMPDEC